MKRVTEDRQTNPVNTRTASSRQLASTVERGAVAVAGGLLGVLALAACTVGPSPQTGSANATPPALAGTGATTPGPSGPGTAQPGPTQSGSAESGASTSAEDAATGALRQKMTDVLNQLAAGTPKPASAQVTDALTGAGIAPAVVEVSASRTPTGLEADAVDAAVLEGMDCVVGQIRDGNVTITVLPVLASGKCFVGAAP